MADLHAAMKFRRLGNYLLEKFGDNIDELITIKGVMAVRLRRGGTRTVILTAGDLERNINTLTSVIAEALEEAAKCHH